MTLHAGLVSGSSQDFYKQITSVGDWFTSKWSEALTQARDPQWTQCGFPLKYIKTWWAAEFRSFKVVYLSNANRTGVLCNLRFIRATFLVIGYHFLITGDTILQLYDIRYINGSRWGTDWATTRTATKSIQIRAMVDIKRLYRVKERTYHQWDPHRSCKRRCWRNDFQNRDSDEHLRLLTSRTQIHWVAIEVECGPWVWCIPSYVLNLFISLQRLYTHRSEVQAKTWKSVQNSRSC